MEEKKSESWAKVAETISNSSCPNIVSIFPTRYTVRKYLPHISAVKTDYDEIKGSEYTLDVLRQGYLYVYDATIGGRDGLKIWKVEEGGETFRELKNVNFTKKDFELSVDSTNHITISSESKEAYFGFLDVLWTEAIFQKVVKDEAFRNKFMTKVNVSSWSSNSPTKNTFDIEEADVLVKKYLKSVAVSVKDSIEEAYIKMLDKLYGISSYSSNQGDKEKKVIGVTLFDNIGLVLDLNEEIIANETLLYNYLHDKAISHKLMMAQTIEHIYQQQFSAGERKAYYMDVASGRRTKEEFFAKHAEDKMSHVDEKERQDFLKAYDKMDEFLRQKIDTSKKDRLVHLNRLNHDRDNTDFGTSLLAYDDKDSLHMYIKSRNVDNCIKNMVSPAEAKMFQGWLNIEKNNPIIEILENTFKYKADSYEAAIGGFGDAWRTHVENEIKKENLAKSNRAKYEEAKKTNKVVSNKLNQYRSFWAKKHGRAAHTIENILFTIHKNRVFLTGELAKDLDGFFALSLKMNSKNNAVKIFSILSGEHVSQAGAYKKNIRVVSLSYKEFEKDFKRYLPKGLDELAFKKNRDLKGKLQVLVYIDDAEIEEFDRLLDEKKRAKVTLANGNKLPKADVLRGAKDTKKELSRYFAQSMEKVFLAPIVLLFNAVNINEAINAFDAGDAIFDELNPEMKNNINKSNLVAGLLGGIGALSYAVDIYKGKELRFSTKSFLTFTESKYSFKLRVSPFFGYAAAFADFYTQWKKADKAYEEGNIPAGNAYMLAGLLLGVGGALVSPSKPNIWGFVVGGILIILGIIVLVVADVLNWDDLDKWLNASYFGKHDSKISIAFGIDYKEERKKLFQIFYQPELFVTWDDYSFELKILFPTEIKESFQWGICFPFSEESHLSPSPSRMFPKLLLQPTLTSETLLEDREKPLHLRTSLKKYDGRAYYNVNKFILDKFKLGFENDFLNLKIIWNMSEFNHGYRIETLYRLDKDEPKAVVLETKMVEY